MGSFADAIELAQIAGGPADLSQVRHYRSRTGMSIGVEQQVVPDVGIRWGRPDDTFGLAGIVNEISGVHQAFLNAGGLGILVGDGILPSPGREKILETYYKLALFSWQVTFDYQFIANPAYNRDRGPVSVVMTRLHTQF
jgi:high affinity Mn2+ porin